MWLFSILLNKGYDRGK